MGMSERDARRPDEHDATAGGGYSVRPPSIAADMDSGCLNLGLIKAPCESAAQRLRQVGVVPTPLTLKLFNDFIYRDTNGRVALVD